jgi:hypothetical protein
MVQATENLATITGTVLAIGPHPRLKEWSLLTLQLESVQALKGSPDLWAGRTGQTQPVAIRTGLLEAAGMQPVGAEQDDARLFGAQLRCAARLTMDGIMCQPYPEQGSFALVQGSDPHA